MRGRTAAVAALVCGLALTGCSRYDDDILAENGLEVPVVFVLRTEPEPSLKESSPEAFDRLATAPGDNRSLSTRWPDPGPPWHIWPLSELKDPPCREDLHIVAYAEDGRTIVRDRPVCPAGTWTVTD